MIASIARVGAPPCRCRCLAGGVLGSRQPRVPSMATSSTWRSAPPATCGVTRVATGRPRANNLPTSWADGIGPPGTRRRTRLALTPSVRGEAAVATPVFPWPSPERWLARRRPVRRASVGPGCCVFRHSTASAVPVPPDGLRFPPDDGFRPAGTAGEETGPVESSPFGPSSQWRDDDLIAVSRDVDAAMVLDAYRSGVFPMPVRRGLMGWWSPLDRGILPLDGLRVTRSLRKMIGRYEIRVDTDFAQVLDRCADPRRPGSWIDRHIRDIYTQLHHDGVVHSVEAWTHDGRAGRWSVRRQPRRSVRGRVDVPRPGDRSGRVQGGAGGAGRPAPGGRRRRTAAGRAVADRRTSRRWGWSRWSAATTCGCWGVPWTCPRRTGRTNSV